MKLKVTRAFLFLASIFFIGCAFLSSHDKSSKLEFATVLNFQVGITSQDDIVSVLGKPSHFEQKDNYFIMDYNDSKTGFQKLSVHLDKMDKKILNLFWMPESNELESSLEYVKKKFVNTTYQVEEDKKTPSHLASSGILFYINKKDGVTVRFDKRKNKVEAIALFKSEDRIPSSAK